jgi:hypothetical protein
MKRIIAFIIFCSCLWILGTFVILCSSTKAQWEDAEVQRLTYNTSVNNIVGFCIDKNEKLFLFYSQRWWDPQVQPYRDTLFLMTKEKEGEWSQPERISKSSQEVLCGKYVDYDPYTGLIHLFYECGETLYYTNSNMPNWETVKTDSGSDRVHVGAMAFDSLGSIHLVWNVDFDSIGFEWYRVMYANNSTGEWVKQQVSEPIWLGLGQGPPLFLAVQKNGAVHIVYNDDAWCDTACFPFYVRNDSLNSMNWITDTIPKPSRPLWHYWAGPIKVDVSDRVHLITCGCIEYDCPWPSMTRTFYYYKQAEASIWQGEEQIPDSVLGERLLADKRLFIDLEGIPYVSYRSSSSQIYFTDRRQGSWPVPYFVVGWSNDPPPQDSVVAGDFYFVLDSQGRGYGAFSGSNYMFGGNDDSLEIYYFSSSNSDVDTEKDYKTLHFDLFQNYPNPFNSSTIITYEIVKEGHVTMEIYDILGREVRELVSKSQKPDHYKVTWDGRNNQGKEVASGIYFYRLATGDYKETKRLVLIK